MKIAKILRSALVVSAVSLLLTSCGDPEVKEELTPEQQEVRKQDAELLEGIQQQNQAVF